MRGGSLTAMLHCIVTQPHTEPPRQLTALDLKTTFNLYFQNYAVRVSEQQGEFGIVENELLLLYIYFKF